MHKLVCTHCQVAVPGISYIRNVRSKYSEHSKTFNYITRRLSVCRLFALLQACLGLKCGVPAINKSVCVCRTALTNISPAGVLLQLTNAQDTASTTHVHMVSKW